jgi:ketosteroid isomerase-like protein
MTLEPTDTELRSAIHLTHELLMRSIAQRDAAAVAALYSEDGQLLPAYSSVIRGKAAIQAFWQGCLDMGITSLQRSSVEMELFHSTANEVGTYLLYGRNGKVIDIGKYVVIWKEQAGQWKIHRDIWTSNLPSAP